MPAQNETDFYLLLEEEWAHSGLNSRRLRRWDLDGDGYWEWKREWEWDRDWMAAMRRRSKWPECVLSCSVYIINQAD